MTALFTIIVLVFVTLVLVLAAYAVFELTPFAKHTDRYRDQQGKRRVESPRLD